MTLLKLRRWPSCRCILHYLAVIFLVGCVPITERSDLSSSKVIGWLEATGPNVYYNFSRTKAGRAVKSGDNVSTGPGSRATVTLNQGGSVTIDENTDPQFLQEAWCVLVKMLKGQVHGDGPGLCFETPHASGVIQSEVNFRVTDAETIITVFAGSVELTSPSQVRLERFQQVRILEGRVLPVRTLSSEEVRSVFRWIRYEPEPISPRDSIFCQQYAETAVAQQQENMSRQCGFESGRWSKDYTGHFQWCQQVPQHLAERESQLRNKALRNECRPDSGSGGILEPDDRRRCQQYAETAVAQQQDNQKRQCGFQGGRWSADYAGHFAWCRQVPSVLAERETLSRTQALRNECRSGGSPGGGEQSDKHRRCQQYAENAVTQHRENIRRQCGYQGGRWSTDYTGHFEWCLQVPQLFADIETRARNQQLHTCSDAAQQIR